MKAKYISTYVFKKSDSHFLLLKGFVDSVTPINKKDKIQLSVAMPQTIILLN